MNQIKKTLISIYQFIDFHTRIKYLYKKYNKLLNIRSSEETLDFIIRNRVSVARFGDYEFMSINEESNNFQTADKKAAERLKEVLSSNLSNLIVCMPYGFKSQTHLNEHGRKWWTYFFVKYGKMITQYTHKDSIYFDASFTRYYMDSNKKGSKEMNEYVAKFKKIWWNRDLFIVEGNSTRFGVGDDFLEGAKSIKRIIVPPSNAFYHYNKIYNAVLENVPKESLVLCAIGMTATVLAYDLAKAGYQAIDIGHADIEYSWYKLGVDHKVAVSGKAVNEVGILEVNESTNQEYLSQIVTKIF